jgi:hypothetical protein
MVHVCELFQEPFPAIAPSGLQKLQPRQQVFGMASLAPISVKLGDELALVCYLPLSISDLLLGFRQTLLKVRAVHCFSQ